MQSSFLLEFKAFAMRGNVLDMAMGVIIGGAFGKIVSSIVSDIIMPALGVLIGGVNFSDLKIILRNSQTIGDIVSPAVVINYGMFIQAVFDFVIIVLSIFMLIRLISKLGRKEKESEIEKVVSKPEDVMLSSEIRDLLKEQKK